MDNLDNYWLVNIRSESLTSFFKLFPFFASDYFYIIVLAVGYWLYPRKKLFVDLGFLVPFATLINIILKNSFAIPRPALDLHLVPYHIDYGFPSGDVQVGIVFWGMIFLNSNLKSLKVLSCFIVIGISLSRVYLGVHSVADVIGGLTFGSIILLIYNNAYSQALGNRWFVNSTKSYWYLLSLVSLIYVVTVPRESIIGFGLASIGALTGMGLSLKYIKTNKDNPKASIFELSYLLVILFIFYKSFPLDKSHELIYIVNAIVKYATLTLMIYALLPALQRKVNIRNHVN